jgi:predicted naringenin-chalcone synthase
LSKIVSIGTAVPAFRHEQKNIFEFMHRVYAMNEVEKRKLKFLYNHCGIGTRYSVLPDYGLPANEWEFFPASENLDPFPSMEERMKIYQQQAAPLSLQAIKDCLKEFPVQNITHLITVSCTGMSAPGLDLELLELLDLPVTTWRTSINLMGCYAAIHALKLADTICRADPDSHVLLVCTECCTLHFQNAKTENNITSSLLFGDGAAAVLVSGDKNAEGLHIDQFYSSVSLKGKKDMVWEMSSTGFQMTLSGYIPELIGEDFDRFVGDALQKKQLTKEDITHWCIHPGGKRILEAIHSSLGFTNGQFSHSYDILKEYGNMSSPTILFVLDRIRKTLDQKQSNKIFGAAFGPGLTMETFILST